MSPLLLLLATKLTSKCGWQRMGFIMRLGSSSSSEYVWVAGAWRARKEGTR